MNDRFIQETLELLAQPFMLRAMVTGSFVAVCCSILGVFLVLRRYSMIGDGLSHVAIGTVGLAVLLGWTPVYFSIPIVTLSSLAIPWLAERAKVYGDAAIAMLSGVGMALGVLFVSISKGSSFDLKGYLFGSILSITSVETWISIGLSVLVIGTVVFFFHDLFACTFEPEHARVLGINTAWMDRILLLTSGLTVVLAVRFVGAMLVTSLIVFPAVTALQLVKGFRAVIVTSVCFGVGAVLLGILVSSMVGGCPSGPLVVLSSLTFFLVSYAIDCVRR